MYMPRKIDKFLADWKSEQDRKPLIVKGSRQVGKTESIRHFATDNYDSFIEIDLGSIKPMIAMPFHPSNTYTIEELILLKNQNTR